MAGERRQRHAQIGGWHPDQVLCLDESTTAGAWQSAQAGTEDATTTCSSVLPVSAS